MNVQATSLDGDRSRQNSGEIVARHIIVCGMVQGVGFRPFVHRLATGLGLKGSVRNLSGHVEIHVEGRLDDVEEFQQRLTADAPPLARPIIASITIATHRAAGFEILGSAMSGQADVHLPPDRFLCEDCWRELFDPSNRRYRHPFITCTQCGPRYTLIERLPYDRENTGMSRFPLCADCRAEYESPGDRRFHAEPLSCRACGPRLAFKVRGAAHIVSGDEAALAAAVAALGRGAIIAVRGIGGYHLMCDASNAEAVATLRRRKRRPSKPLAVLFPQSGVDGLDVVRQSVVLDDVAAGVLRDPARPIVLAPRRADCPVTRELAPGLDTIGVFLPYSPLHALLTSDIGRPLVATSANVSGEPVIIDSGDAELRLAHIADGILHHDRPILRPADDAVVHVVAGSARALRLGRGTAPLELTLPRPLPRPVLAVGGQMKCAIGIGFDDRAVLSPHIGDLESPRALGVFEHLAADLPRIHAIEPAVVVADAHPHYVSSRWARSGNRPVIEVLHHHAHASGLGGEHPHVDNWLVFVWDATGMGADAAIWGGEALVGRPGNWRRVASIRPLRPLGLDLAARAPWRSAAAVMWECGLPFAPPLAPGEAELARLAWDRGLNAPPTSGIGRLFDAAATLILDLRTASFEGEAPMQLEALAWRGYQPALSPLRLPLARDEKCILRSDWRPLIVAIADTDKSPQLRAHQFHLALAAMLVDQAHAIRERLAAEGAPPFEAVGLTGGVFQNKLLAEMVHERLATEGFTALMPVQVPANDGGLAFGQIVEAAARLEDTMR